MWPMSWESLCLLVCRFQVKQQDWRRWGCRNSSHNNNNNKNSNNNRQYNHNRLRGPVWTRLPAPSEGGDSFLPPSDPPWGHSRHSWVGSWWFRV